MGAAALAKPIQNNVIKFKVVNGGYEKKYRKDGQLKKTHTNRVSGKSSEVFAFRTKEEIKAMIDVFDKHIKEAKRNDHRKIACRNKLMFLLGINVGLRASDIRVLKWTFFYNENGEFNDGGKVQPKKTKKTKKFVPVYISNTMKKAIENYLNEYPVNDYDTYLFVSRKSTGRKHGDDVDVEDSEGNMPIAEQTIWKVLNDAAKEAGIKQNIGSHSLRKTFGYWVWHNAEDKEDALVKLQYIFNHSDTRVTAKYIGITDDELRTTFTSIELGNDFI